MRLKVATVQMTTDDRDKARVVDKVLRRAFRDLRTSTLMPPTVDRMLEGIGKNALGIEAGMFNVGRGAAEGE